MELDPLYPKKTPEKERNDTRSRENLLHYVSQGNSTSLITGNKGIRSARCKEAELLHAERFIESEYGVIQTYEKERMQKIKTKKKRWVTQREQGKAHFVLGVSKKRGDVLSKDDK